MRKQLLFCSIAVLFISTSCKKVTPPKPDLRESLQKIVDEQLINFKGKFPGKMIGFGLYVKQAGGSSHGQTSQNQYVSSGFPESYGDNIHFRGASTTKTFTMAAILALRQQNKLNLDDLITANIPGTNQPYIPATSDYAIPNKEKITIRLLLQHRAGVFDVTNTDIPAYVNAPYAGKRYFDYVLEKEGDNHTFTFRELISVVAKNQLTYFQPGTAFHYSNTGYNLLATIIERVSGKRYDQFMQDQFLTPLQMSQTKFPYLGTDQKLPAPYASGWLRLNGSLIEFDEDNVSFAVSEGNIITTPADLSTWANALYATNTLINSDLQAQMIAGIPTNEEHVNYGLGTELNPPDLGYGHNGARPAYMTVMKYHPGTKTSYVLFANFLDADGIQTQGEGLDNIVRLAIQAVKDSE